MLAFTDQGQGPPLLFVHGIGSDRRRWEPLVELLDHDYRCVTVDLPGHGGSPDDGCDLLSATVAVHEVASNLDLGSVAVVGHSLGATVALLYSALYKPRSAVAIDPVGLYTPHLAAALLPYRDRLLGGDFDAAFAEWEAQFRIELVPEPLRTRLLHGTHPRQSVVLSYWRTLLDEDLPVTVQAQFADALASIQVPTLICLANPPTPEDEAVLARMTTTRVEVYAGLGHYLHLVDVKSFVARLRAWMQQEPDPR